MDWQKGAENPELSIRVTGHAMCGRHLHYVLECFLCHGRSTEAKRRPWLEWKASRRLVHLRAGLHDLVKHYLGSSYKTYFCQIPFARRLRPAGTTERLDVWCNRLACCLSHLGPNSLVLDGFGPKRRERLVRRLAGSNIVNNLTGTPGYVKPSHPALHPALHLWSVCVFLV
ncbi:Peptidylprolyl isomerase [Durusdinium trenchii]|uniref:Peptidylprolyl isomerase n=1 Tax=Durusdinium trenchii TaxID=1381693 RepID=A0ABP0S5M0_9DINO